MRSVARLLGPGTLLLAAACSGGEGEGAPAAADTTVADSVREEVPRYFGYAVVRGTDTLAIERVLRSPGKLSARVGDDAAGAGLLFEATTGPDGLVRSITVEAAVGAPGGWPGRRSTVHFEGGFAITEAAGGDPVRPDSLPVPAGTLPYLGTSVALVEQVVLRALSLADDTVSVPLLSLGGTDVYEATVRWETPTSVVVDVEPDERIRVTLDEEGRVERMENVGADLSARRMR